MKVCRSSGQTRKLDVESSRCPRYGYHKAIVDSQSSGKMQFPLDVNIPPLSLESRVVNHFPKHLPLAATSLHSLNFPVSIQICFLRFIFPDYVWDRCCCRASQRNLLVILYASLSHMHFNLITSYSSFFVFSFCPPPPPNPWIS